MIVLDHLPKDEKEEKKREDGKPFELKRNITVDQIRRMQARLTTFAIYAIGCLQIPLYDLIVTSTVNVLAGEIASNQVVSALDRLYLASHLPTLIVWGDKDKIIPVQQSAIWRKALPNATVKKTSAAGSQVVAGRSTIATARRAPSAAPGC